MDRRLIILLAWVHLGSIALAQGSAKPADKDRLEQEARGQAAEADRLFKAREFSKALPLYQAERRSRAALGDARYGAYATRAVGCCRAELGDDDAAIAEWTQAVALDAKRDDPGFEGYDWLLIGAAHLRRDRPNDARKALERALPKLTQAVDQDHEADARLELSRALLRLDRAGDAGPHLKRAEELAVALKDRARLASSWFYQGLVATAQSNPALAIARLTDARRAYVELGNQREAADSARELGAALAEADRHDAGAEQLAAAEKEYLTLGDEAAACDARDLLAAVRADLGQLDEAARLARLSARSRSDLGDTPGQIQALVRLADYRRQKGDWKEASVVLDETLTLARDEETTPAPELVRLLLLAAGVDRRAENPNRAGKRIAEAKQIATQLKDANLIRLVDEASKAPEKPGGR